MKRYRLSSGWRIFLGVAAVVSAIATTSAFNLYRGYQEETRRAEQRSRNLSEAVARTMTAELEKIDIVVSNVVEQYERNLKQGNADPDAIEKFISGQIKKVPEIEGIRIADDKGVMFAGFGRSHSNSPSIEDRDYFISHRDNPLSGLIVGKPLVGRISQKWIVTFSRRYVKADGSFAGVVIALLTVDSLRTLLSGFDLGPRGVMTLRSVDDLGLVLRHPETVGGKPLPVGDTNVSQDLKDLVKSGIESATYHTVTPYDQTARVFTYQKLKGAPFFALAGLSQAEYLRQWQADRNASLTIVGVFAVVTSLCGWVIWTLGRRHDSFVDLLAENNVKLSAVNAEYAILSQTDRAVVTSTTVQGFYQAVCDATVRHGLRMAWVGLVDDDGVIRPVASAGQGTDYLQQVAITTREGEPSAQGPSGQAFLLGRPVLCQDFINDPRTAPWHAQGRQYGWRSSASLPIFEDSRAKGVFTVYSDLPEYFSDGKATLLEDLSNSISRGLDRFAFEQKQKDWQARLRSSEARFSTVFRASPVAIVIASLAEDRLVDVNPAFLSLFGHSYDDVIGRREMDIGIWDDVGDSFKMTEILLKRGRVENLATLFRTNAGELREVLVATEIIDIEGVSYRLSMLSNVTDLRQAERALVQAEMEKMHAMRLSMLGEVTSMIAHEVNQPIGAVANYLQAAITVAPESRQNGLIEKAIQQLDRAAETIRRVKDFAANRKIDRPVATPIGRLLEDGCALALLGNTDREIAITFSVPDVLGPIMGDPVQVQQVITNLVRNAAEAVRDRDVRRIGIAASQSGNLIEIEISDSGPGVGPEVRSRLFRPFVTSKPDGTGLGLSTSRSIIRAHGGELWCAEDGPGGACFHFTLPMAETADA
ncbi:MAG TPA: GAF domain-containing protein [Rhodospirillaceae bacterium]|nr:GAF domain-containing protein [Rhodospirillaceae bacterium]